MSAPAFSVLMPAFDAEATIGPAIRSVLAQTRGDFELIVVDDGSTDRTAEVVAGFLHDTRVRLVRQRNGGLARARNTALAHARAPYVSLLDSDDLWMPRYLDVMGQALAGDPGAAFVYCDAWLLDDATRRVRRSTARSFQGSPRQAPATAPAFLSLLLLQGNVVFVSVTARRAVLEAVGGFNPALRACEDYELWLRLAARGHRALRTPLCLAVYRQRAGSLSADELRMSHSRREVHRLVVEEYDVPVAARARARAAMGQLDDRIAVLEGRRPEGRLAPARRLAGRARRRVFTRRVWHARPPAELTGAFPDLRAV